MDKLKWAIQPKPSFVTSALKSRELEDTYLTRPAYQWNDYLAWINRAVREVTKRERFVQMLSQLAAGNTYMGMAWKRR